MSSARIAWTSRLTALAAELAAELMPEAASLISENRLPQPESSAQMHVIQATFVIHFTSSPSSLVSCYNYLNEKKNMKKGHEGGSL